MGLLGKMEQKDNIIRAVSGLIFLLQDLMNLEGDYKDQKLVSKRKNGQLSSHQHYI